MPYELPRNPNNANSTTGTAPVAGHLMATIALVALVVGGIAAFAVAALTLGGDEAVAEPAAQIAVGAPVAAPVAAPIAADLDADTDGEDVMNEDASADNDQADNDQADNDSASTQPVPPAAAPAPPVAQAPAPAPAPFRPVCSPSKPTIEVGETTVISGNHTPSSTWVTWTFDHGDGYREQANPSYALYHAAGTYEVTAWVDSDSGVHEVPCGFVTVTAPAEPIEPVEPVECSTEGYVGVLIGDARDLAESRGCEHRTFSTVLEAAAELDGDRQLNRVNFIAEQINPFFPGQDEAAIVTEAVVG